MAENSYKNIVEIPEQGFSYFRHFFIPHEGNDHKPALIRPTALKIYSIALITVKLVVTGFLYAAYPTEGQFAELTAAKIVELTNTSRAQEGLPALVPSAALNTSASRKANDMVASDYFDHTGPDGKKFWQWISEAGYSYSTAGENLAMDFTTAESAHNALMASASHRKNIMKSTYTHIGVSVIEGEMNGRQTTILVEHFGAPATVTAPTQPTVQPTTQPVPQPAPAPTYEASYVGRSDEQFALLPASDVEVWVDFKNTGTATWTNTGANFLALNVTDPVGRASDFQHPSWVADYRPAVLEQARVAPGSTGRFRFILHAPATIDAYAESFAVVAEGLKFLDGAAVTLPITVVAPPAPAPAPTPSVEEQPTPQEEIQSTFNTTAVEVTPVEECVEVQGEDVNCPVAEGSILPDETPSTPTVVGASTSLPDWLHVLIDSSARFFWAFLLFLTFALMLNVLVKVRVQHRHVVLQTLAVIALASLFTFVRFHFAEGLTSILIT